MLLEGLHIPLTTPFHPDGRLNPRKLAANVMRYSKTPAAGLIVLGPSGEPTLLSDDETREVLRTAAEAAAQEKVLIAGISRDGVRSTLDLANFAAEQNYDAILVGVPAILSPLAGHDRSDTRLRELLTYFRMLADRSPLPIILLSTSAHPIAGEAVVELAAHSHIIALLDSRQRPAQSDTFEQLVRLTVAPRREVTVTHTFQAVTTRMKKAAAPVYSPGFVSVEALNELLSVTPAASTSAAIAAPPAVPALRTRTRTVGFQILSGCPTDMLYGLVAGAAGVAPAFAASAPQACYEVFAAWKDGDQPLAEEKQLRLLEAAQLAEATPAALKQACDLNGYFGGLPRLPHLPPTGAERAQLEQLMKPLRN